MASNEEEVNKRLLKAAERCNTIEMNEALKAGAEINYQDKETGNTALHKILNNDTYSMLGVRPSLENQRDAVALLIVEGANPDIVDMYNKPPSAYTADDEIHELLNPVAVGLDIKGDPAPEDGSGGPKMGGP